MRTIKEAVNLKSISEAKTSPAETNISAVREDAL
jgi:hypothetical protein